MNKELRAYLKLEAIVAAAFGFFISGMIAALIHHKADMVPVDAISLAVDLAITCLAACMITEPFCRTSLRRSGTAGILENGNPALSRLFRLPVLFGFTLGLGAALTLFAVLFPVLALFGIYEISFGGYMALKTILCALLGGCATLICLRAGMSKVE